MAKEIYADGISRPEVKDYVGTFLKREFERRRNVKTQAVCARAHAQPGRSTLIRVLEQGFWSVQRTGAGKQREYALDDASDVWDKCLDFFHWAIDKPLALDTLLDVDEVCLFFCGHIGWLRHSTAARHNGGRQRFAPAGQQLQEHVFNSTDKHCHWPRAQTRSGWQT